MIELATYENFDSLIAEGFTLVDFYSVTCGPCKILSKILEEVACELPFVNIAKVNLTYYPDFGTKYEIDAVPTVLFVKDGEILERVVGLVDREEITEKIGEHYYG